MSLKSQAEDLEKLAHDARLDYQTAVEKARRLGLWYTEAEKDAQKLHGESLDATRRAERARDETLRGNRERKFTLEELRR